MQRNLHGILTIGVTGTKGKTSTAEFVAQLLEAQGLRVAVSTTESARIGTRYYEGFWSVPELARFVALSKRASVDCLVIELCSSGLRWDLHSAFTLDVAILTNIGTDHIRDHGNRRNYVATKQKMFRDLVARPHRRRPMAILNADDPAAPSFRRCLQGEVTRVSYGVEKPPGAPDGLSLAARDVIEYEGGTRFIVDGFSGGPLACETRLHGTFNVSNTLAAISCVAALGYDPHAVVRHVSELVPPPGRFDMIARPASQPGVVVDYAHTPESLHCALQAARSLAPRGRLHVVFGCGGDAYKRKRPLMGAVAARLADRVVVTSDNPRREIPAAIAEAILAGVSRTRRRKVVVELDRRSAITAAIQTAAAEDLVLIAGKGNERTQDIDGRSLPFSDSRVARQALDSRLRHTNAARPLTAIAAVVLGRTGTTYFDQHAELPRAPASLVKLMTLYLAFEALAAERITADTAVAISRYAATTPHPRLPLRAGDRVPFRTLLRAVAIRSSNAAATALAESIAGDEATFVARMNVAAETLGLTATRFATPHGLPHRHQTTTARDMARLLSGLCCEYVAAAALLRESAFRFRGAHYTRRVPLLGQRGVLALKTGFTWEAGYNLAFAAGEPGVERYFVVLGATTRTQSFSDGKKLLAV